MIERRSFLVGLSLATPWLARQRRGALQAARSLDPGSLRPVADVVLPSELGAAGIDQVVAGFGLWVRGYRPNAELLHGYGSGEIRRTGPSPAPRWIGQLESLDREAVRRGAARFGALSPADRRTVIEAQVKEDRLERVPPPAEARHVAIGLLAYFFQTPAADDLCYRAKIGKLTCRPLAATSARPGPR
jgi:hypothetical protein